MNEEPRYKHNCSRCVFLGYLREFDLYACPQANGKLSTVVARHSSDGPDYLSGLDLAVLYEQGGFPKSTYGPILLEALKRARAIGFTTK